MLKKPNDAFCGRGQEIKLLALVSELKHLAYSEERYTKHKTGMPTNAALGNKQGSGEKDL
jgi:hypothetical protein